MFLIKNIYIYLKKNDSSNKIRDITLKAFSHAEGHLELNFSNFLDTAEAKDLIDMYLDEA